MSAAVTPAQTPLLDDGDITKTTSDVLIETGPVKRFRRLLSGRRTDRPQRYWGFEGAGRHGGTGGAKANPDHPSRKHDVEAPQPVVVPHHEIPGPVPGQPPRRQRRAAARAAAKAERSTQ